MPKSSCQHCWQPIEYPPDLEGQAVPCPSCGKTTLLSVSSFPVIRVPERKKTAPGQPPAELAREARDNVVRPIAARLIDNIEKIVIGKRAEIELVLVALLSEGHALIEDVPGVAKTMLARALAQSLGCEFKRLQCTPDLLPNDITGSSIFNPKTAEFEFRPGPVFAQVLLADEINRATPRTQSALLEAMAERQVTVDGKNFDLGPPFFLIATQNPIEHEGTFPLPEAQLDRFFLRLSLGYPGAEGELEMLARFQTGVPLAQVAPVSSAEELCRAQEYTRGVYVDPAVREYALRIVHATRIHDAIRLGASPRATLALARASQALAALQGYDFVLPDHVKRVAPYVLAHRILLRPETRLRKTSAGGVIAEIMEKTEPPGNISSG